MRLMSVALTASAVENQTKTVTRRLGWKFLKKGDQLALCRKVQGRNKGEPLERLAIVQVVDVYREPLWHIGIYAQLPDHPTEMDLEGMGHMTSDQFIEFFCKSMKCDKWTPVTRIEWRYLK